MYQLQVISGKNKDILKAMDIIDLCGGSFAHTKAGAEAMAAYIKNKFPELELNIHDLAA